MLTEGLETTIAAEITHTVDDATDYAESQPDPTVESAAWYVYAEDTGASEAADDPGAPR